MASKLDEVAPRQNPMFGVSRSDFVGEERDALTPRFIWAIIGAAI